ncbi:glycosyltransferase [Aeromicrobium sp.]|uniref:glycosyltransferase n=1 Tax=Aeromicrobium sp. TaxID=1871063 RepID=UPI0028B1F514|nr:glycosyltransferase [Aeromicrobium sp.]
MTGVTVGVVVYDTDPRLLERCFASIRAEQEIIGCDIEIIVVDNSSSEPLRSTFEGVTDRWIPAANDGFAVAANRCVAEASNEYVLLLNPDAALAPRALGELVRLHEPGTVLCGWLVTPNQGLQIDALMFWWSSTHRLLRRSREKRRLLRESGDREIVDVSKVSGGATFGLRSELLQHGPYDEDFFLYGEDADFSYRFRSAGGRLGAVPSARIEHEAASSQESHSRLVEDARVDAAIRLTAKHLPVALDYLARLDLLLVTLAGVLVPGRTSSRLRSTRLGRLSQLRKWGWRRHVKPHRPSTVRSH